MSKLFRAAQRVRWILPTGNKRRRGIVLLIVLSLLTLFILLGVSFAIVASKYQKAAWDTARQDQLGDPLPVEANLVLDQLLYDRAERGTLQFHSLLRDLYGEDSVEGAVVPPVDANFFSQPSTYDAIDPTLFGAGQVQQSQIIMFAAQSSDPVSKPFSPIPHYYAGRVLTFTSSPRGNNVTNLSSRIIDYALVPGTPPTAFFAIEAPTAKSVRSSVPGVPSTFDAFARPQQGDTFLVNGAPFNGAGAGFTPFTHNLDATVVHTSVIQSNFGGSLPSGFDRDFVALLPHYAGYETSIVGPGAPVSHTNVVLHAATLNPATVRRADAVALGGMDEKWDAVDNQNMFLAMVPPAAARLYSDPDPTNNVPILPSFHRPELVNYWVNQLQSQISGLQPLILAYPYGPNGVRGDGDDPVGSFTPDQLDRIHHIMHGSIFRPMPWDHPSFTGGNPNFEGIFDTAGNLQNAGNLIDALRSPVAIWDVDNDKDGVPDSIWIDPGLPVITTADGRRIKRLAAILIKDLDGSIDLNAHGNLMQISPQLHQQLSQKYGRQIGIGTGMEVFRSDYQLQFNMPDPFYGQSVANFTAPPGGNYAIGLAIAGSFVPRGMGFGPAEVNFLNILNGDRFAYGQLLSGRYQSKLNPAGTLIDDLEDTNGPAQPPGAGTGPGPGGAPDNFVDARPGIPQTRDPLSWLKHYGIPNNYGSPNPGTYNLPGVYASPPDVWGRSITVLDVGGQPVTAFAGMANEMVDSPYEISLSGQYTNDDSRYTPAELERLLRYHDGDAQNLPDRLLRLAGSALPTPGTNPLAPGFQSSPQFAVNGSEPPGVITGTTLSHERRQMLAGMTSHIPAPSVTLPTEARQIMALGLNKTAGNSSILDLYFAAIYAGFRDAGVVEPQLSVRTLQEMLKIVPHEFFRGQKFDINRWLGNGNDDPGINPATGTTLTQNFAIDDPAEAGNELVWPLLPPPLAGGPYSNVGAFPVLGNFFYGDLNGDGAINALDAAREASATPPPGLANARQLNRQLYARHLFCMALLFGGEAFAKNGGLTFPHENPLVQPDGSPASQAQKERLVIRRIAQWAINCVDFRDPDSTMTPFEFDYNPWNGWQVDGDLTTDGGLLLGAEVLPPTPPLPPLPPIAPIDRGLVWGMEAPDLIITETFAIHDRRSKDTNQDPTGKIRDTPNATMRDPHLDQLGLPQGSLFLEFLCPRAYDWTVPVAGTAIPGNQKPHVSRDLYDANGRLMLYRTAPPDSTGAQWPVWRVALSAVSQPDPNSHPLYLSNIPTGKMESASFDPANLTLLAGVPPVPTQIERFSYFADISTLPETELRRSFSNLSANANTVLDPGQYAVMGPRPTTYLGSINTGPLDAASTTIWSGFSPQVIVLDASSQNGITVTDTGGNTTNRTFSGGTVKRCLPVVCTANDPTNAGQMVTPFSGGLPWTKPWPVGLNITEPLPASTVGNYYEEPQPGSPRAFHELYDNPGPTPPPNGTCPDEPQDSIANTNPGGVPGAFRLADLNMLNTGTYIDYSSVYLQRLANPNIPHHLVTNPYITVDWASIDVTVFNGEEDDTRRADPGGANLEIDPSDPTPNTQPMHFRTRQRGYPQGNYFAAGSTGAMANPWIPQTINGSPYSPTPLPPTAMGSPYFYLDLSNDNVTTPAGAGNYYYKPDTNRHTLGYLNEPIEQLLMPQSGNANFNNYRGEPATPFPWLTWNNRPFMNAMELLLVPSSTPSRIFSEFMPGPLTSYASASPPALGAALVVNPFSAATGATDNAFRSPFGSLFNFYSTSSVQADTSSNPWTYPNLNKSPHFYRLLDFVEVPSPYLGAEKWYNPTSVDPTKIVNAGQNHPLYGPQPLFLNSAVSPFKPPYFAPPFNKLSRFRDPGRININTIFESLDTVSLSRPESVWDALVGQFPGMRRNDANFLASVLLSRQGYGTTLGVMNPNSPTLFANPFRAADSADLMPNVILDNTTTPPVNMRKLNSVEATLLRPDPAAANKPLFQMAFNQAGNLWNMNSSNSNQPVGPSPGHALDISRNPYFRFQPLQKLGNILTTNSNCFAVWITIGYFELEDNVQNTAAGQQIVVNTAHPDGLRLGQEVGADRGNFTRHRAFYLIDRSIPVGFKPGVKLNTDDCILLKRMIE